MDERGILCCRMIQRGRLRVIANQIAELVFSSVEILIVNQGGNLCCWRLAGTERACSRTWGYGSIGAPMREACDQFCVGSGFL